MYYYPFLILTNNHSRNSKIADTLQEDTINYINFKKKLFETLSEEHKIFLYELLEIYKINNSILINVFNKFTIKTNLIPIDSFRLKEKLIKLLKSLRNKCLSLHFPTQDGELFSIDDWEGSHFLNSSNSSDWNNLCLQRLSDIHAHIFKHLEIVEYKLLVTGNISNSISTQLPVIIETMKSIHKEIKEYLKFIESL